CLFGRNPIGAGAEKCAAWRVRDRPIFRKTGNINHAVDQQCLPRFIHFLRRKIKAEMQQMPLPPDGGSGGRLVVDASAQHFRLGRIQSLGIRAPSRLLVPAHFLDKRQGLDSRTLYRISESFGRGASAGAAVHVARLI
ncbi:MAG TPA: hypothetical protein VG099_03720, partial [Gemmataceae bacterium]|nr:hypothetical protein [Gemmataceae bacterium]